MTLSQLLSFENLQFIGTACGAIAFTAYVSFRTFKSKLDKEYPNRNNISKNIKRQSDMDYNISVEADKLKELLNADRVQIYEFHNGNHYANGRSALKTSCTYETCRYGVNSCLSALSGIPLSVIPNFLKSLLDKGELLISDLEEIKTSMPATYSLKHGMGIKGFYDVVIYNDNKEPVGFVGVQFCNDTIKEINKDEVKKFAWFVENELLKM